MVFELTRDLAAPIADVWAAWTDAEKLAKWYSPGPINWVIDELDVRPGGAYHMHMETPKGPHVAEGVFHEVEEPTKLVQGPTDGSMRIATTLTRTESGTRMTVAMPGLPAEQHEMMRGAWNAGFDKLEALL